MTSEVTRLRALCATIPAGPVVPCCGRAGTEGHRSSWSLGLDGLGARVVARMDGPVQLLVAAREGIPALCDELGARDRELARLQGLVDARRTTEEAITEKARREADDLRAQLTAERQRAEAAEARCVRAVAAEREVLAGIADGIATGADDALTDTPAHAAERINYLKGRRRGAELCAEVIRARGEGGQ